MELGSMATQIGVQLEEVVCYPTGIIIKSKCSSGLEKLKDYIVRNGFKGRINCHYEGKEKNPILVIWEGK